MRIVFSFVTFMVYQSVQITTEGGLVPQILARCPGWQSVFEAQFSIQREAVVTPASQELWSSPPSLL